MNDKNNKYDSTQDTINHIANVRALLDNVIAECQYRVRVHDESKLKSPEAVRAT